jgi:hypothetical protein
MEISCELEGREFDWFAIDQDGHLALFATGGCGPIPEHVRVASELHDAMSDTLSVTGWGTDAVWQSYSRIGLFAYDWSVQQNCYVQVAKPIAPPSLELQVRVRSCSSLAKLDVSFQDLTVLRPNWQNGT